MAIRKNNNLESSHFHKWWQRYVKTWFHQPSQKLARRYKRNELLTREAPRPVGMLRPVVRPPSPRHNMRLRGGRGFSVEELKRVGISKKVAPTIGIAVDKRRRNRSEEGLTMNVDRLKEYMSRLVVFAQKTKLRKGFGGLPNDTSKADLAKFSKTMPIAKYMPVPKPTALIESRAITDADRKFDAFAELKKVKYEGRKGYKKTATEIRKKKMFENRESRRQHKAMNA